MCLAFSFGLLVGDFGGGGRVRTRNTLHIVGAPKSKIWDNAVGGRKMKEKNKKKNMIKCEILEIENIDIIVFYYFIKC